ncbi:hypothetical protein D3C71_1700810 [compost metagenome]
MYTQRDVFGIGVRNGGGAGNRCAGWPLGIAREQIAGDGVFAWVLSGTDQILVQHLAQVRLQLCQTAAVRQCGAWALLNAQVIEFLGHRIRATLYAGASANANILKGRFDGGTGA